jgi:hypothetical protein
LAPGPDQQQQQQRPRPRAAAAPWAPPLASKEGRQEDLIQESSPPRDSFSVRQLCTSVPNDEYLPHPHPRQVINVRQLRKRLQKYQLSRNGRKHLYEDGEVEHKNVLGDRGFSEIQRSEGQTLMNGVTALISVSSILIFRFW